MICIYHYYYISSLCLNENFIVAVIWVAMEHLQHEISTERINLHSHNTKDIKSYFLQKHHVSQRKKMTSGYARSDSKNKIINNKKRSKEKGRNTV